MMSRVDEDQKHRYRPYAYSRPFVRATKQDLRRRRKSVNKAVKAAKFGNKQARARKYHDQYVANMLDHAHGIPIKRKRNYRLRRNYLNY